MKSERSYFKLMHWIQGTESVICKEKRNILLAKVNLVFSAGNFYPFFAHNTDEVTHYE